MSETRSNRKTLIGFVATRSGDKSVKVNFQYTVLHPVYGKEVKRRTVLHAHDEKNECKVGDKVEIMETRPLSKLKRWRVIRVVEAAKIAVQPIEG
jgi:small subunit ribosomal protein S17